MKPKHKKEIERLYLKMHDMMLTYASVTLQTQSLAEEAVQETFYIACHKPEALLECQNPEGWLITTLKYVIRNTLRQQMSIEEKLNQYLAEKMNELSYEDQLPLEVLYGDISSSSDFLLLKELALDKKSHAELASARGISVAACRKRVQRAKENLQKKLQINVTKSDIATYISERRLNDGRK